MRSSNMQNATTNTSRETNQLNYIANLAAQLIIEGKATIDNAFEMAISEDNKRCLDMIEGRNPKGLECICDVVYTELRK